MNTLSPVIETRDLEELIRSRADIRLIDVRTPGEFESVHIRGAYNVPLDALPEHAPEIATEADRPRPAHAMELARGGKHGFQIGVAAPRPFGRTSRRLAVVEPVQIHAALERPAEPAIDPGA